MKAEADPDGSCGLRAARRQRGAAQHGDGRCIATLNLSVRRKLPIGVGKGTQVRFDAINLTDSVYPLRDGTGVGVGAPQYGMRRSFFVTLAQKF